MAKKKQIPQKNASLKKQVISKDIGTVNKKTIWLFDWLDNDGTFAFNLNRRDFDSRDFLEKMIAYSNMTWEEISHHTHDNGKSKHHYLPSNGLSKDAIERIKAKHLDEHTDAIFSFAFQNLIRIIGIRDGELFHVVWYDPKHEFYPTKRQKSH